MADEEQVEMTTNPAGETPAENTQNDAQQVETISREEFEKLQKALKEANREAAERRKKLEAYEKAEAERKQAEMTELEKLQAQLKEAQAERDRIAAELEQRRINDIKRQIAEKVGLPAVLASRIVGNDEEEMEADAKAILEALPKPAPDKPAAPRVSPTNPGGNARPVETDAQKKERIFGAPASPFDPDYIRAHGGGVIFNPKE